MKESDCYVGKKVGRLTLISRHREHFKSYGNRWVWHCVCTCGNEVDVPTFKLGPYHSRIGFVDCGKHTHEKLVASGKKGLKNSADLADSNSRSKWHHLYTKFKDMHRRCEVCSCKNYKNYGGRGIKVCQEWNDYNSFKTWATKQGYDPNNLIRSEQTIDRIDVNGNYEPSNCRLVDSLIQGNNKRDNVNITVYGETHTLSQWARIKNISIPTLNTRWQKGDRGEFLLRPINKRRSRNNLRMVYYKNKKLTYPQAAKEIGVSTVTINNWVKKGKLKPVKSKEEGN